MRKTLLAGVLLLGTCLPSFAQELPPNATLPTVPANPPHNDVWIWVDQPVGPVTQGAGITVTFWAFRCGGTITAVKPSTLRTGPLPHYVYDQPRPDVVAAMAGKCASIPTNIGGFVVLDPLPARDAHGDLIGYAIDMQVTDDLGRKTMLRQSRGSFTIR